MGSKALRVVELKAPMGRIKVVQLGVVSCRQYVGKFSLQILQDKANTRCWYTVVEANPFAQEGEGRTPEDAVADAIHRTEARIVSMEAAVKSLKSVKGKMSEEISNVDPG